MSLLEPAGAKLIAVGVLLLALAGAFAWAFSKGVQHERSAVATQRAKDAAALAAHDQRTTDIQKEAAHEAERFDAKAKADARSLDAYVQRMHVAATSRAVPARAAASAASAAVSVPDPELVCTDLCLRAVDAAAQLAKALDCLRVVSTECAADYNALTP